MQQGVKRLVLDVLKPYRPSLPELAARLSSVDGVERVNISLVEVDMGTESTKITVEGEDIDFKRGQKTPQRLWRCGSQR